MKALIEKRAKLMAELDAMDEKLGEGIETRNVSQEDINAMNQKLKEVKEIDAQIEQQKETRNLKNTKEMKVEETNMETRAMLLEGKEVEIREVGMTTVSGAIKTTNGELVQKAKTTHKILEKARIMTVNGKSIVPVQKTAVDKLVPVAELAEYTKKAVEVGTVDLRPNKYGVVVPVSEELLEQASFDVEQFVREEGQRAIENTIAGKIVETLEGATKGSVARETEGVLTYQDVCNLYFGLKQEYRANGVFVMNDNHLRALMGLVGADGQPILQRDITSEFGYKLFGKEIILENDATKMYFADMNKAVVCGVGSTATVKRSDDVMFLVGAVAFKVVVSVDVQPAIEDALVFMA